MIELIQGTTSTPIDDVRRQEIPSRLAIEKGMYPDEAVTVSQIAGGNGIHVKQTDGRIVDNEGNVTIDLKARGNLVINRNQLELEVNIDINILPYMILEITSDFMNRVFGDLKEKSILIINGIQYNYGTTEWFTIGIHNINGYDQLAIKWLGDDKFKIEVTDLIILRI